MSTPPSGVTQHPLPCGASWLRPEWAKPISEAVGASTKPVLDLALAAPDRQVYHGRSTVVSWNAPGFPKPLVVRRCCHGGLWGRVVGERYRSERRAAVEIENAARVRVCGIPTPVIAGVVFYPSGLFMRMDFITVHVGHSEDLVRFLARGPSAQEMEQAFASIRLLLGQCASNGAHHRDINARNILLGEGEVIMKAYLLDLEEIVWRPGEFAAVREANFARLSRSLRKRRRKGDVKCSRSAMEDVISHLDLRA